MQWSTISCINIMESVYRFKTAIILHKTTVNVTAVFSLSLIFMSACCQILGSRDWSHWFQSVLWLAYVMCKLRWIKNLLLLTRVLYHATIVWNKNLPVSNIRPTQVFVPKNVCCSRYLGVILKFMIYLSFWKHIGQIVKSGYGIN